MNISARLFLFFSLVTAFSTTISMNNALYESMFSPWSYDSENLVTYNWVNTCNGFKCKKDNQGGLKVTNDNNHYYNYCREGDWYRTDKGELFYVEGNKWVVLHYCLNSHRPENSIGTSLPPRIVTPETACNTPPSSTLTETPTLQTDPVDSVFSDMQQPANTPSNSDLTYDTSQSIQQTTPESSKESPAHTAHQDTTDCVNQQESTTQSTTPESPSDNANQTLDTNAAGSPKPPSSSEEPSVAGSEFDQSQNTPLSTTAQPTTDPSFFTKYETAIKIVGIATVSAAIATGIAHWYNCKQIKKRDKLKKTRVAAFVWVITALGTSAYYYNNS